MIGKSPLYSFHHSATNIIWPSKQVSSAPSHSTTRRVNEQQRWLLCVGLVLSITMMMPIIILPLTRGSKIRKQVLRRHRFVSLQCSVVQWHASPSRQSTDACGTVLGAFAILDPCYSCIVSIYVQIRSWTVPFAPGDHCS